MKDKLPMPLKKKRFSWISLIVLVLLILLLFFLLSGGWSELFAMIFGK